MEFSTADLILLNATLAIMMFGVSLQLLPTDFSRLLREPKAPLVGLLAQFVLLPALTCLATWALNVDAELALGMILVASCPGGTFSNIMTWIGRGNVAVSVTMTAVSSLVAVVMTPFNFGFYGWLNSHTRMLLTDIAVPPLQFLGLVVLVLGVPIVIGMWVGKYLPAFAQRADTPMRIASLLVLLAFVVLAISKNLDLLVTSLATILPLVIAHNALAMAIGAASARLARLSVADGRAVTMEVGIQNSGLGLTLMFTFFAGAGGMILIAAVWGLWHLISGLSLALWWSRQETAR